MLQGDKLGKGAVWRTVQNKLQSIPDERDGGALDITDGSVLRWWLWICNLGLHTREVIGVGVRCARVAMNDTDEAVFTFTRVDDTDITVRLRAFVRGQGRELNLYI